MVVRSGILRRSIPVAINAVEVALNQDMKALRPSGNLKPEYLRYLIESHQKELLIEWTKQGATVESIEHELMANSLISIPSLPEQSAMVHFLDYAGRLVRQYILTKQKLIKLLEEQKQTVIHRSVTRGLDPTVQLRSSGVAWLGDIPEHWKTVRIKHAARMESGHTPSRSIPEYWLDTNDIPWVSLNDTKQLNRVDYISDTAFHVNELGLKNSSARLLPGGLLYSLKTQP